MERTHIEDQEAVREDVYQEIVRRLALVDDSSGRKTRYYFTCVFNQVNATSRAYSVSEVPKLWERWERENSVKLNSRTEHSDVPT